MQAVELPTVRDVLRQAVIKGRWDVGSLCELCDELVAFDERMGRWRTGCLIALGVSVLLLILGLANHIGFLAGLMLIVGSAAFIGWLIFKSKDVGDQVRLYLAPLLSDLAEDIKKGTPVSVDLALTPLVKREHLIDTKGPYSMGAYPKVVDYLYDRVLLNLSFRLHDGNRLVVEARQHLKKTVKSKRSASGKSKSKTRSKGKSTAIHRLLLNDKKYSLAPFVHESVSFQGQTIEHLSTDKGNWLVLKSVAATPRECLPDYEMHLKCIMTLYTYLQNLNQKQQARDRDSNGRV